MKNPDKRKGSISKLVKEAEMGSLLEVDVSYPDDLQDPHNDLPFMCENRKINGVGKLLPNLYNKKEYVIHIAALDQALKHELVLNRIHRAIKFEKSAWLVPYIDFNIQL